MVGPGLAPVVAGEPQHVHVVVPGVVELHAVVVAARTVGDVGAPDPAHVAGTLGREDARHPHPRRPQGIRIAVPGHPVTVHLGEGSEVDQAGRRAHPPRPGADVVVVAARGDVGDVLTHRLPADQRRSTARLDRLHHARVERVVPVHEPVHDVEAAAQVGLEADDGLHALPHAAVGEGAERRVLHEREGFGGHGGSAGHGGFGGCRGFGQHGGFDRHGGFDQRGRRFERGALGDVMVAATREDGRDHERRDDPPDEPVDDAGGVVFGGGFGASGHPDPNPARGVPGHSTDDASLDSRHASPLAGCATRSICPKRPNAEQTSSRPMIPADAGCPNRSGRAAPVRDPLWAP
jgi:hypothetical protein